MKRKIRNTFFYIHQSIFSFRLHGSLSLNYILAILEPVLYEDIIFGPIMKKKTESWCP